MKILKNKQPNYESYLAFRKKKRKKKKKNHPEEEDKEKKITKTCKLLVAGVGGLHGSIYLHGGVNG